MKTFTCGNKRAAVRAHLMIHGGAIALAAAMIALPTAASAQNECGVAPANGGTVTCAPTGNPYQNGINYVAQPRDLTVVLSDGVAVSTTAPATRGVVVSAAGTNAVTVSGSNASVTTTGAGATGVDVSSVGGPVTVAIGDVRTSGSLAGGVRAIGGLNGNVSVATGNVTTTGTDGSAFFFLPNSTAVTANASGTGNVTVTTGNLSTAGVGARGVSANAAAGNVTVTTGAITTTGANAPGVAAESATGNVSVTTTGAVRTSGDNSQGIYAVARQGAAAVRATTVTTSGFNSTGIQALSGTGGSTVDFTSVTTGNAFATGVIAGSTGGNVRVTGGSVTATGTSSSAIYAYSNTGTVNVTTTGSVASTGRGGFGIYADAGTGNVSVTANNVSTVSALADDTATSRSAIFARGANAAVTTTGTVAMAGRALYGGPADAIVVQATNGNASATVNNVRSTGATSRAVFVTGTGAGTATINGAVSTTGAGADAVRVQGGTTAVVNVGTGGSITSTNGNLISVTSATGTTINNAGTLGVAQNGYTILATGGPVTINNSGTLASDILLTAGADIVNNTGRFNASVNPDFGAGTDVFNNSGTVALVAGSSTTFTGLETFNNTGGLVDLRNGVLGDRLTLPGAYAGSGAARLGLDVDLGGTTADRLVIGGAATGSTSILLNQVGTSAVFNPGTVLVQAGAGSAATAFTLGATGSTDIGLVRYQIRYNADSSYSLIGGPSDAAFRTLNYVEGIRSLWLNSADAVSTQLQARRDSLWAYGDDTVASGKLWLQISGSVEQRGAGNTFGAFGASRAVNTGYEQDYFGGQLGLDFGGGSGERGGFAFGVTGGYTNSSLNFNGSSDRIMFDAANVGIYASYTSGNLFINGLGKYDFYWAKARSVGAFDQKFDGGVYGGRVEAGFRFGGEAFFVEPVAAISYVKSDMEGFAARGTSVAFDDDEGLRGRAGARLGTQFDMFGTKASIYAGANYVHEFRGDDRVTFASGGQTLSFVNDRLGDYGEAKLGLSVNQSNGVSGFIEGTYKRTFDRNNVGRSDIEGAGGRAGIRLKF